MENFKQIIKVTVPTILSYLTFLFVDGSDVIENFKKLHIDMMPIITSLLVGSTIFLWLKLNEVIKKNEEMLKAITSMNEVNITFHHQGNDLYYSVLAIKQILNLRLTTPIFNPVQNDAGLAHINQIIERETENVKEFLLRNHKTMTPQEAERIAKAFHVGVGSFAS